MATERLRVTVTAREVRTQDGKRYKQGSNVELDRVEARRLVNAGLAREEKAPKQESAGSAATPAHTERTKR